MDFDTMLAPRHTILWSALGFTCLAVHGCTPIEGGAVEVSWDLRTFAGNDIPCEDAGVLEMRLWWRVVGDDTTQRFDQFSCDDERGVTGFDLPAGTASLWLVPVCDGDAEPAEGTYRAPAPIVRTITEGDVITLDTQLVELDEDVACQ
jgi:hypothetical protein